MKLGSGWRPEFNLAPLPVLLMNFAGRAINNGTGAKVLCNTIIEW